MREEEGLSYTSQVVLFSIIGLFVGTTIKDMKTRGVKVPYTPIILAIGIVYGTFARDLYELEESTHFLNTINPQNVLMVLLPILLFETAYSIDWYLFKKCLTQIIILGTIGVIITIAIVSITIRYLLNYDIAEMPWIAALTLGAIIAFTDPITTSSLYKELNPNPNPHLSIIAEGESLVGAGISFIFFSIFYKMMLGAPLNILVGFRSFWFESIGGTLIGLTIGYLNGSWLEKIKDEVLTITLLIISNFLVVFIAFQADCSELVALITFGLYNAATGKIKIHHEVNEAVNTVLTWFQYCNETLIFLIAGGVLGLQIALNNTTITVGDWGKMIGFFFITLFIRFLVISLLSQALNKSEYRPTWKEFLVLGHVNLKGGLSLLFALMVQTNTQISDRTADLFLFYVSGLAVLSILFNGMTTSSLVRTLKMIPKNRARRSLFRSLVENVNAATKDIYFKLKEEHQDTHINWDMTKDLTGLEDEFAMMQGQTVPTDEIIIEGRKRILDKYSSFLWEHYNAGLINSEAAMLLDVTIRSNKENIHRPLRMFEVLYQDFINPSRLSFYTIVSRAPFFKRWSHYLAIEQVVHMFDLTRGLISMIEENENYLLQLPLGNNIVTEIQQELLDDKGEALAYLLQLETQFPEFISYINTKRFATKVIAEEQKILEKKVEAGTIDSEEAAVISKAITSKLSELKELSLEVQNHPKITQLVSRYPTFNLLTPSEAKLLNTKSKIIRIKEGVNLLEQGKPFKYYFLLLAGQVELYCGDKIVKKSAGKLISPLNLIDENGLSKVTCKTATVVRVQQFDPTTLRTIIKQNPKFEDEILRMSLFVAANLVEAGNEIHSYDTIKELLKGSQILRFKENDTFELPNGGCLYRGSLFDKREYAGLVHVLPSDVVKATSEGIILKFGAALIPPVRGLQKRKSLMLL